MDTHELEHPPPRRKATYVYNFCGGVEAHLFGRTDGDIGRAANESARETTAAYARAHGMNALFAINPQEFNAKIVTAKEEHFAHHEQHHGIMMHFGAFVDGVAEIPHSAGFWIRSADCPTIVLIGESELSVLHGGLRSLIAQHWRPEYKVPQGRPSVIQAAIARTATALRHVRVRIICGIGPMSYPIRTDHPVHGPYNERLVREIRSEWGDACIRSENGHCSISLIDIIIAQCMNAGIPRANIIWDEVDTATEQDGNGRRWYSASEGDTTDERNHILIFNARD